MSRFPAQDFPFYSYSLGWHTRGKAESRFFQRPREQVGEVLLGKDNIFFFMGLATGLAYSETPPNFRSKAVHLEVRANLMRAEGFRLAQRGEWNTDLSRHSPADRSNIAHGMGWYFGVVKGMPRNPGAVRAIQPVIEWMETAWRTRRSASWDDVQTTILTLEPSFRGPFQAGTREGRLALARLLRTPTPR